MINKLFVFSGIAAFFACCSFVFAEEQAITWNEKASSNIIRKSELDKFGESFTGWKYKQMVWPDVNNVNAFSVQTDAELKESCIKWMQKFISKDYLPDDLFNNLVAMKEWGLIRDKTEQKRLCDVFITRFRKGSFVVHLQESPYNITISVSDETLMNSPRLDYKQLVIETANKVLKDTIKPDPNSKNIYVFEVTKDEQNKVTRVSWLVEATAVIGDNGTRYTDLEKVGEIGTTTVEAETDGRFVKFEVIKRTGEPRAYIDPYIERFSSLERQLDPNEINSPPDPNNPGNQGRGNPNIP